MLWIAFIYRTFALWKQRSVGSIIAFVCCELLSFIVLLLFENSVSDWDSKLFFVVNCFHLSYFCSLKTALHIKRQGKTALWIAFIYRTFALWKQHSSKTHSHQPVVNCFHLSYFCSLKTAWRSAKQKDILLWIAFIYRTFALWKQLKVKLYNKSRVVNCFHLSYFCSLKTA